MNTPAKQVFAEGMELTHIYDFGTSSETLIRVVGEREGKPLTNHPITLMARNDVPEVSCMECEQTAAWFCLECVHEDDNPGFLCDQHAKVHPHIDCGEPTPLVNSPRLGMCGYDGPATTSVLVKLPHKSLSTQILRYRHPQEKGQGLCHCPQRY